MSKISSRVWLFACLLTAALLVLFLSARTGTARGQSSEGTTQFIFSDHAITVSEGNSTGYEINGTELTICADGTYLLSGSCADGSVTVKKGTTGVTLVLSGLTLTSSDTAPLTCSKSTAVTIRAADGTVNTLTDAEANNDESFPDNASAENAVIKCKDGSQVTLCGSGTLKLNANGKNGIKSGASTQTEGEASLTIRDLTLDITAPVNDAINAEQALRIESGTLTISAADDAIHCDRLLSIGTDGTDGPEIRIAACYEGLEAAELQIASGSISISSEDDCLNAASSGQTDCTFSMTISGGTIRAYSASGDGFDSNGDLTISGGTVVVWTANTADNQPLDADGTLTVSGGTVLAAGGSSGMGVSLTAEQPFVTFGDSAGSLPADPAQSAPAASLLAEGCGFTLEDASGQTVYSGTAECGTNYLFFSSADLTDEDAYTLRADSGSVGTATAQTGTVAAGGRGGMGRQHPDGASADRAFPARSDTDRQAPPELPDGTTPPDGSDDSHPSAPPERDASAENGKPSHSGTASRPQASETGTGEAAKESAAQE